MTPDSFTGRGRRRKTRASVLFAEGVSRVLISVGGVGTIVAVSMIMVFLTWVVVPLWAPAELEAAGDAPVVEAGSELLALGVDDTRRLRWTLADDGLLRAARVDDGAPLDERRDLLLEGRLAPRVFSTAPGSRRFAAGYDDGRVVLGVLGFDDTVFAESADADDPDLGRGVEPAPPELVGLPAGEVASHARGVVARMSEGKLRYRELDLRTLEPLTLFDGLPVVRLAASGKVSLPRGTTPEVDAVIAAVSAAGELTVQRYTRAFDLFEGEEVARLAGGRLPDAVPAGRGAPAHLFLTRLGDHVLLVWEDGYARHFLFRGGKLGHERDLELLDGGATRVTALAPLLGETTAMVADDAGAVRAWFPARPAAEAENQALREAVRAYQTRVYALRDLLAEAGVPEYELPFAGIEERGLRADHAALLDADGRRRAEVLLAELPPLAASIAAARAARIEAERQRFLPGPRLALPRALGSATALACSDRSRLLALGTDGGAVALAQVNDGRVLGSLVLGEGPVEELAVAPKEDALYALAAGRLAEIAFDPGHPEASFASLFTPVRYEGLPEPAHAWQSTGGTDAFEPKLGLMPLVFGTLKATLYSMLFGAPLALLAALYSSEFLKPRLRASLKSILELMASLPSVVLGFLAALIIAPYVQEVLPGLLAFFLVLPFTLVLGANLWQLMPRRRAILWSGWQRFAAIVVALPAAVWFSSLAGPLFERLFFAGNVDLWLDGQLGGALGGWLLLFLPLAGLLVFVVLGRVVNPRLRAFSHTWDHARTTRIELVKFIAATLATILLATLMALAVSGAGLDPRGTVVDSYVQRNALVVGFVMGFAVIPIIYTLAEDALSSVPAHLRDASLGCGATPWQTAVRVIVPTAMSGLFSAVMIGLGRAVGETMIVLMAAGNTPVMDWNVFNGFRTLSANIAVELPEAARDTTHYRVLFLAALTLFLITFVLNTLAEVVRSRFRRRAFQL